MIKRRKMTILYLQSWLALSLNDSWTFTRKRMIKRTKDGRQKEEEFFNSNQANPLLHWYYNWTHINNSWELVLVVARSVTPYVRHNSSNFKLCLIWPNWYCLIHFYKRCVSTLAWLWRCALLRNELFMLTTRLLLLKSCPNISERSFFQNNITYSSNILTEKCSWTRSAGECRWWSCFLW